MRVLLRDLAPGQQYAIQFRSNTGERVSDWSQVQRFTTTNDTIAPSQPQNLSWYDSGAAFIADWDAVTTQATIPPSPLNDFRYYRINVSTDPANPGKDFYTVSTHFELSKEQNTATFGTYQTALYINVYAVDMTYNESSPASKAVNPLIPPTPSIPAVDTYLGALRVTWNGKDSAGNAMPKNFDYVEVHVGTSASFVADTTTFKGRIFADASAFVITNLAYDTDYWVRLIAVNLLAKRSSPTPVSAKITVTRLSGLTIQNGSISPAQINFSAYDIGGANAYYSTSQPTSTDVPGGFKKGDVWYDTDNGYQAYSYDGTTWVINNDIGVVSGTKIIAGTITGDRIASNFFSTAYASIGSAYIDAAYISSVNAATIKTGSLSSDGTIIAGPQYGTHAEMRSTGFYVMVPDPSGALDGSGNPVTLPQVKMGTGDGDNLSIVDPNQTDSTLASIDTNGIVSAQGLYVETDPIIQGQSLSSMIDTRTQLIAEGLVGPINGLNQSGAQGIRGEYGLGQFSFSVQAGRTYSVEARLNQWSVTDGGEPHIYLRLQKDQRTATDISNGIAPTAPTINSSLLLDEYLNSRVNGWGQQPKVSTHWRSDFTGVVTIGFSMALWSAPANDAVIKVLDNSYISFFAYDLGRSKLLTGQPNTYGQSLYSWTAPAPPPPPSVQQYSWSGHANWVRSYKGNGSYMSNTNGLAYQGTDPSGYNGNQSSHYGFGQVDFAGMLAGASNISINLYLYYQHWYYNSGGTAVIGYHNNWGDPGGANRAGGAYNLIQRGGVPKPGSFNIDVSGWAGAMQNGSFRGIALGPGPSSNYAYYGYASDCALTVTYTK